MAHDFEDLHNLDDLTDDELRDVVREHLREHGGVDVDSITVHVEDGVVNLAGRVGTEAEARMAERIVTDTLGIERFENELAVDALRRDENPAAIDDTLAN
jgi:osmotically-inducible protein OsmY